MTKVLEIQILFNDGSRLVTEAKNYISGKRVVDEAIDNEDAIAIFIFKEGK